MIMYKRFRDSIIYPEQIIQFRNDSIFRVLLYMLMFATLLTLPMIIDVIKFEKVPLSQYNELKDSLYEESFDCEIQDFHVLCDTDTSVLLIDSFNGINVYVVSTDEIDYSNYDSNSTDILLYNDQVILLFGTLKVTEDLSYFGGVFENIDFKDIDTDFDAFSQDFILNVQDFMLQTKGYWGSLVIGAYIMINFIMVLFIGLLTGFVIRMRFKKIPFRQTFRFGTYVSSTTFLALMFMTFFGQVFFFVLIILFTNSRQLGRLTLAINQAIKK